MHALTYVQTYELIYLPIYALVHVTVIARPIRAELHRNMLVAIQSKRVLSSQDETARPWTHLRLEGGLARRWGVVCVCVCVCV